MAVATHQQPGGASTASGANQAADALVVFGITGDLAKVMTFRSLYRLERARPAQLPDRRRGGRRLDRRPAPRPRAHVHRRHRRDRSTTSVFRRLRRSPVLRPGRLHRRRPRTPASPRRSRVAQRPVFYLEIPPFLFATVIKGLSEAGLTEQRPRRRREAVRPRPRVGARARRRHPPVHRRVAAVPDRSLPRQDGTARSSCTCASRTRCSSRSGTATTSRASRSRWPRASASRTAATSMTAVGALQDVVVNHLMQLVAMAAMEAPAGDDAATLKDAKFAVFRSMPDADPQHYVRGQYDGYLDIDGVAPGSTTETYAALRLEIDNWRWAGRAVLHPHRQAPAGHPDRGPARVPPPAAARVHVVGRAAARRSRASSSSSSTRPPASA